MAIDADVRAGAIDADEARRRRRALERESQLHDAMHGALKFVKGDSPGRPLRKVLKWHVELRAEPRRRDRLG
jgi:hypothetical protein